MNASEIFSNTVKSFGLAAHRGYLTADGACTNDLSQKGTLKDIFALARSQLFNLIQDSRIEHVDYHRELMDACILNTVALKCRFQEKVGYLAYKIFNGSAKQTVNQADLLIAEARAANRLLAKLKSSKDLVVQVDDVEETFNGLFNNWQNTVALLDRASQVDSPLSPLFRDMVSWTTKHSVKWLTKPFSKKFPLNQDELYRLLPHLDFHLIKATVLQKIRDYHLNPKSDLVLRYWRPLSQIIPKMGLAFIHQQKEDDGKSLMRTGVLMKTSQSGEEVERIRNELFHPSFPNNLLKPRSFITLLEADNAGLLTNEWIIATHQNNLKFSEILQTNFKHFTSAEYAKKAGVFVLLANRRNPFQKAEEACKLFEMLLSFREWADNGVPTEAEIKPETILNLVIIYDWLIKSDRRTCDAFDLWYPEIADYLRRMDRDSHSPRILPSQKAILVISGQNQLSLKDRYYLITAVQIETSFPRPPEKPMLAALLNISQEGALVLQEKAPYLYYLKKLLTEKNEGSLNLTAASPLLYRIISGLVHHCPADKSYSELELLLLMAGNINLNLGASRLHFIRRWLQLSLDATHFAGRFDIDDQWLKKFIVPPNASRFDFSDTWISPVALSSFLFNHPNVYVTYRNSIHPGKVLLELNSGDYQLKVPGGIKNVHHTLIEAISGKKDPLLEPDEVTPFLEYCYTHQMSSVADHVLINLYLKAQIHHWNEIDEYCLARLLSTMEPANLLARAKLAQQHRLLAPLRVYCAQYSLAHCLNNGIFVQKFHECEYHELVEIARGIFEPCILYLPVSLHDPVDLSRLFPANHKIICADNNEVWINLEFLSLHSGYFKALSEFRSTSNKPLKLKGSNASGPMSITPQVLSHVDSFARTNKLPKLTAIELYSLCYAARYLDMPALKMALVTMIKPFFGAFSCSYINPSLTPSDQLALVLLDSIKPSTPEEWQEIQKIAEENNMVL